MLCEALSAIAAVRVRVVDDGSGPEQQAWIGEYVASLRGAFPLLDAAQLNGENRGKGAAVYSGWDRPDGAQRLAFVDADGAVLAEEIVRVLQLADTRPDRAFFAVRTAENGTRVERAMPRRLAGSVFRWLVRRFFRFPLPDTQCGFKIVPAGAYLPIRPFLKEMRFTFDVELTWFLLRGGVEIVPVPINWKESPGTRLRAGSAWEMFRSIQALRVRLGDWRIAGTA